MSLRFVLAVLFLFAGPARAEVIPLNLSSDYCTILRAFSQAASADCPAPEVGLTRSLGGADRMAVPPGDPMQERGYFIRFAFNSKDLSAEYKAHLTRLGQVFHAPETQGLCFKLVGHTDAVGSAGYNMALSEQRARTVHLFLVGVSGVTEDRLKVEGRGETALLPGVAKSHGLNRRVEILARPIGPTGCP